MTESGKMTPGDFEPCLDQVFTIKTDAGNLELKLVEVKLLTAAGAKDGDRQPFSLLFRGPLEPALAQQLVPLENPTLGELQLFLVPIGPEDNGMLYDATFN